jgi:uncharacterized alkaline shock family protein YloU
VSSGSVFVSEVAIARAAVAAVRTVPGVVDVSPGRYAEAATYGPGERVGGVAVRRDGGALDIQVHLRVRYSDTLVLPELAAQVRIAVHESVDGLGGGPLRTVGVAFDDVLIEGEMGG